MKTKNYFAIIFSLCTLAITAQEKNTKKKESINTIVQKKNVKFQQFVLDYLKTHPKIRAITLKNILYSNTSRTLNQESTLTDNTIDKKRTHLNTEPEIIIFLNNEIVLNKLDKLEKTKMNTVQNIIISNLGFDQKIYIEQI